MARKLIGVGVTDANGEATITYTGTGAGKLNIVAESGAFVSQTQSITDAKYIFQGTSYITSAGKINNNTDGTYTIYNENNYCLFDLSTSNSTNDVIYAEIGECFEFDLVEHTGSITLRCNINDGSNRDVNNIWENNTHYKIEIVDNGVKINGTTKTFTDTGARQFRLRLEDGATFKIKNLLYY